MLGQSIFRMESIVYIIKTCQEHTGTTGEGYTELVISRKLKKRVFWYKLSPHAMAEAFRDQAIHSLREALLQA